MEFRVIQELSELEGFQRGADLLSYSGEDPFAEKPDEHLIALNGGQVEACCSLWWSACPQLEGERLGCIGHFYAKETESGRCVLAEAEERLRRQGASLSLGPMNGNTWRRYRFVVDSGETQPFALEPRNPGWWPELWRDSGYEALAGYHSSIVATLFAGEHDPRIARAMERLEVSGVRIRNMDKNDYENELKRIYSVSERSFVSNYLYTPLSQEAFLRMYLPFLDLVEERLALLAECEGDPVGFVFALPDVAQMKRGEACDRLIIKTLAILPGRKWAGLGSVLVDRIHKTANKAGFKGVIHALMHDRNDSANIGKQSEVIRRYALFCKKLSRG